MTNFSIKQGTVLDNLYQYHQEGHPLDRDEWSDEAVGPWIRPVSEDATGELTINDVRLNNDNVPQILDIIQISVVGPAAHPYQKENVLTVKRQGWTWCGKLPVSSLPLLYDDVALLWMNGYHSSGGLNDRIPKAIADKEIGASLYLIKPVNFVIFVSDDLDG